MLINTNDGFAQWLNVYVTFYGNYMILCTDKLIRDTNYEHAMLPRRIMLIPKILLNAWTNALTINKKLGMAANCRCCSN